MVKAKRKQPDRAALAEAVQVCACTNFRKAARVATRLFDEALEPCGLRATQLALLLEISLSDRTTVPRLARSMVTEVSTVARNLQPLIARRLVGAHRDRGQRAQNLALTSKGWKELDKAVPLWETAQAKFVDMIGPNKWPQLLSELRRVSQAKM
jgi:DNA-binding MarR family transcriptional regulator